jgi:hypothetical protein
VRSGKPIAQTQMLFQINVARKSKKGEVSEFTSRSSFTRIRTAPHFRGARHRQEPPHIGRNRGTAALLGKCCRIHDTRRRTKCPCNASLKSGPGKKLSTLNGFLQVYVAYATMYVFRRLKPSARKEQDAIVVRCVLATETALLATVPVRTRIVTRM